MPAMTPMKCVVLFGTMILVEDMSGRVELKATCPNEREAEWLAGSLVKLHKVPLIVADKGDALIVGVARR